MCFVFKKRDTSLVDEVCSRAAFSILEPDDVINRGPLTYSQSQSGCEGEKRAIRESSGTTWLSWCAAGTRLTQVPSGRPLELIYN